ncbi:hypothetical protein EJ03DRAFT_10116 [Teratosphaeria nubilosa]|uniref:Ubiquitin-like domain-containing protein n=1 Tax=Teratosphaeria nubilosa TaxID=161662 RepID=A0A6G1LI55_9PEZI|nr:hypothetical protein EJ03DRAFT_10116 [Teratosphaeria nubilosa]
MVTFSSVGDIISVSLLVKDLLRSIHASKGAAAEYQEVVRELYVLDTALLQVSQLANTLDATPELRALGETAKDSVDRCRICLSGFQAKTDKYDSSLAEGRVRKRLKAAAQSIQWQVNRDAVDRFRAEISSHSEALNLLLATAHISFLKFSTDRISERILDRETQYQALHTEQTRMLMDLRDKLEASRNDVTEGRAAFASLWPLIQDQLQQRFATAEANTRGMSDSLQKALEKMRCVTAESKAEIKTSSSLIVSLHEQMTWLTSSATQLKKYMLGVVGSTLAIYQHVAAIRSTLTTALTGMVPNKSFMLEDAIGRITPVSLDFISSCEAFETVIEIRFQGSTGYEKVLAKQYVLCEIGTARDIVRTTAWEFALLLGQKVRMMAVFQDADLKQAASNTCSFCGYVCEQDSHDGT